jgi:hypothetical protein
LNEGLPTERGRARIARAAVRAVMLARISHTLAGAGSVVGTTIIFGIVPHQWEKCGSGDAEK